MLNRFVSDNGKLQLLATSVSSSNSIEKVFGPVVRDHALDFFSLKHLDMELAHAVHYTPQSLSSCLPLNI